MQRYLRTVKRGMNKDHCQYCFINMNMFSCGKSFTMQGLNAPGSPQRGIIPRSFEV